MKKFVNNIYCKHKSVINIFMFIAALCYTFSFFLWNSLDDVYFWYYNTPYYTEDFLECGFWWFGNLYRTNISDSFFSFRLLGWISGIISVSIPYICFLDSEQRRRYIWVLSLGLWMMSHMTFGSFCPDSLTFLVLIMISTILCKCQKITTSTVFFLSLLTAIAITIRFPNILTIVFAVLYITLGIEHKPKKHIIFNYCCSYIIITLLLYYILISFIYNDLNLLSIIEEHLLTPRSTSDKSHNILFLLKNYAFDLLETAKAVIPISIILFFNKKIQDKIKIGYIIPIFFFLFTTFCLHFFGKDTSNAISYNHKVYSLFIIALIFLLLKEKYSRDKVIITKSLVIIGIGLVACAGSNTGINKIFPYFAAISPVLYIILNRNKILNNNIVAILLSFFLFSTVTFFREKYPHCSWTGHGKWLTAVQDYKHCLDYGNYFGFLEEEDYNRITREISLYETYGNPNHTLFYGNPSAHEMYGTIDTQVPYFIPYYMANDDKVAISILLNKFEDDNQSVLFDYSGSEIIETYLQNKEYKKIYSEEKLRIYTKNKK